VSPSRARGRTSRGPRNGAARGPRRAEAGLTVAVTGPTGTFGSGLVPMLQADDRIARIIGIARRPFDPGQRGWTKMTYRQGDVRDPEALEAAFRGADVVVHLAFLITGNAPRQTTRAINVDGTLNTFRAATAVGAQRFVYASSIAAYGFGADLPDRIDEDWPVRPAARLFYAREKAELEGLLETEASRGGPDLFVIRPPIVVGPDTVGSKNVLPGPLAPVGRRLFGRPRPLPVPLPVLVPEHPLQLVHADDVGQALLLCVVGAGPPGAYNIAGDGVLTAADVAREFGALPVRVPAGLTQWAARTAARLPFLPPVAEWIEAAARPVLVDTTRAKEKLGWVPRYTGLEALRDTLVPRVD
jgi:nucleoside-diphosphate-sugar epimerase